MSEVERQEVMKLLSFYKNEAKHTHLASGWGIFLSMGIQAICGGKQERVVDILHQLVEEGFLRKVRGDYYFK